MPSRQCVDTDLDGWLVGLCLIALIINFGAVVAWALFTALGSNELPQVVLATKDLSIVLAVSLILLGSLSRGYILLNRDVTWILVSVCFVVGANLFQFFASSADAAAKLVNLRRNILPLVIIATFALLPIRISLLRGYLRFVVVLAIILAAAGFVEYFMPDYFWDRLMNIDQYQRSIAVDPYAPVAIVDSGRFYSWDLLAFSGGAVRRMVSGYFEPTTLASFFSFTLIMLVFGRLNLRFRLLWVSLIVAAGVLTISKAFIVAILLTIWFSCFPKLRPWFFLAALCGIFGLSMLVASMRLPGGYFAHLEGFYRGVLELEKQPFGAGLGLGGNYADVNAATADDLSAGAESGIGNLIVQIGLVATVYVFIIWRVLVALKSNYERTQEPLFRAAFVGLLFWSLTLIMSASSLGLSGNAFYFVISGLLLSAAHVPVSRQVRVRL